MYPTLLRLLIVLLVLCSVCLQGCRPSFRVTYKDLILENPCSTSSDGQANSQVPVPDVLSSAVSNFPNSRLPTATLATLSSAATSTVQVASPVHHPANNPGAVPSWQRALSTEFEKTDMKSADRPTAQAAELSSVGHLESLHELPFQVPAPVFGASAWSRYFGEVGVEPPLPADIDEILARPCPFWPGKAVKDTHLLVLIPSTVGGMAFTLDLLEELIQSPRGSGHGTQYFLYDDEVQQSLGDLYPRRSYWVLLTRDVLPGSRNKPYATQKALFSQQSSHIDHSPYEVPNALEVATAILSHYVRSGDRLYEGFNTEELPSTSTRCVELLKGAGRDESPVMVGRFCTRGLVFLSGFDDDAEFGLSCLRRFGTRYYRPSALLPLFGAEEWSQYFGEVEAAPSLPEHIVDTLNSPCPFWPDKQVKDTHLLVLIPATVAGKPFNLNLLGELIQHPKGGGHSTAYHHYHHHVQRQFGAQSPAHSYWVLMTCNVLEGSKNESHAAQEALVAGHAGSTGLPYELPNALEAATAVLSHYVRSGEHLHVTLTRCKELVNNQSPVLIGGFSSRGLDLCNFRSFGNHFDFCGVSCLQKF